MCLSSLGNSLPLALAGPVSGVLFARGGEYAKLGRRLLNPDGEGKRREEVDGVAECEYGEVIMLETDCECGRPVRCGPVTRPPSSRR